MGTILISGLRTQFHLEYNNETSSPNAAEITIWNMAKTTRDLVLTSQGMSPLPLVLNAGYGEVPSVIFQGDILPKGLHNARQGPDWLTTFKLGDGLKAWAADRTGCIHCNKGSLVKLALLQAVGKISNTVNTVDAVAAINSSTTLASAVFSTSTVIFGRPLEEINRILAAPLFNCRVKIVQNHLEFFQGAVGIQVDVVPSLSSTTGLIGSADPAGDGMFKIRCLLRPEIRPDRQILVIDEYHPDGLVLIADRVTHTGDTRGQDWYTDIEGHK